VKDIYLEQEFEVVVILFSFKDYLMSDFALKKKVPRVYGKRTSFYRNHQFNKETSSIYKDEVNYMDDEVYKKSEEYWNENRFENLSKDE
jgi:arginine/lysine/ornithine decarboxylase